MGTQPIGTSQLLKAPYTTAAVISEKSGFFSAHLYIPAMIHATFNPQPAQEIRSDPRRDR
jgi:hypothetical protein